jgi:Flp pilus assembly protein TadG
VRAGPLRRRSSGQALVEFAIVVPLLMLLIGGIVQFGIIFWGQNTLTQIARDTGRWASTQINCDDASVIMTANSIADQSSLIGKTAPWTPESANVEVTWGSPCPPPTNQQVAFVSITLHHRVPIFFPWVPGDGDLTTSAQFRMEPKP